MHIRLQVEHPITELVSGRSATTPLYSTHISSPYYHHTISSSHLLLPSSWLDRRGSGGAHAVRGCWSITAPLPDIASAADCKGSCLREVLTVWLITHMISLYHWLPTFYHSITDHPHAITLSLITQMLSLSITSRVYAEDPLRWFVICIDGSIWMDGSIYLSMTYVMHDLSISEASCPPSDPCWPT